MLSRLGVPLRDTKEPPPVAVTLPDLSFLKKGPPVDDEPELRETAGRFLEARTIKAGAECWQAQGRSNSFAAFLKIGRALLLGRKFVLESTGANAPMGARYCVAFSKWTEAHGFVGMQSSLRSVCIDLAENSDAITAWRNGLPERQRKRLVHPLSVTRRWLASTHANGKSPTDLRRDAKAALTHFRSCVTALPRDEARVLWRLIAAEATIHIS